MIENWPKISIVLPIRNEAKFIAHTIKYLQEQDYPRDKMEILARWATRNDNTAEIVKGIAAEDSRVKYLHNPKTVVFLGPQSGSKGRHRRDRGVCRRPHLHRQQSASANTARLMIENDVRVLSRPQFLETPDNTHFPAGGRPGTKSSARTRTRFDDLQRAGYVRQSGLRRGVVSTRGVRQGGLFRRDLRRQRGL